MDVEVLSRLQFAGTAAFPDHAPFDAARCRSLADRARREHAEGVLVTAKDWVKIRRAGGIPGVPVAVPTVAIGGPDSARTLILRSIRAPGLQDSARSSMSGG